MKKKVLAFVMAAMIFAMSKDTSEPFRLITFMVILLRIIVQRHKNSHADSVPERTGRSSA